MQRWNVSLTFHFLENYISSIIDQQLTCNLITSTMSCYYHTSLWKCINNTGCDLTQFRYYVRIFPKSGFAADSNRVNKNVANAWRKLKRINGSRFLKLIYCYAIHSVLVSSNTEIFIYTAFYPEANTPVCKTQSESPTFLSFYFGEVHRLLIYFVSTLILRSMLPLRFVHSVHVCYNSGRILAQGWSILFTVDSIHSIDILHKSVLTNFAVDKEWFSHWIFVLLFLLSKKKFSTTDLIM